MSPRRRLPRALVAVAAAPCTAAVTLGTLALFAVLSVPAFRR